MEGIPLDDTIIETKDHKKRTDDYREDYQRDPHHPDNFESSVIDVNGHTRRRRPNEGYDFEYNDDASNGGNDEENHLNNDIHLDHMIRYKNDTFNGMETITSWLSKSDGKSVSRSDDLDYDDDDDDEEEDDNGKPLNGGGSGHFSFMNLIKTIIRTGKYHIVYQQSNSHDDEDCEIGYTDELGNPYDDDDDDDDDDIIYSDEEDNEEYSIYRTEGFSDSGPTTSPRCHQQGTCGTINEAMIHEIIKLSSKEINERNNCNIMDLSIVINDTFKIQHDYIDEDCIMYNPYVICTRKSDLAILSKLFDEYNIFENYWNGYVHRMEHEHHNLDINDTLSLTTPTMLQMKKMLLSLGIMDEVKNGMKGKGKVADS